MRKNLTTRTVVIAVILLVCIFGVIGFPKSKAELIGNLQSNIRLGLDLKGGSHMVMEVQVQDAAKGDAQQTLELLQREATKQNITWASADVSEPQSINDVDKVTLTIRGVPADKGSAFRDLVTTNCSTYALTALNTTDYSLKLKPSDLEDLKRETVQRAIDTISNRINDLGVAESSVQQYGQSGSVYQILIQLPGVEDTAHARQIIGTTAVLSIVGVDKTHDTFFTSRDDALAKLGGIIPLGETLVKMKARPGQQGEEWYLVGKTPVITGKDIRSARPGQDDVRKWQTSFTLSQDGGRRFGRYTGDHVNDKLAVILDNSIVSVATINERIEDSGRIMGLSTEEEAVDLGRYLRSGSLPARVTPLFENSVGPSLGADSIHQGILSGVAGLLAVVTVMLLYYKRSGVNAVLALILNTVILLAAISYFHAALTLPGIAGVILTIGMAVDSNVLIFERIREELRTGKGVISAVDTGFNKAWWTIVDTHVTTVVSCAFLFLFGEGPVRGFAVTLTIGLIANVFTAVFVSRTIFGYELSGRRQLETLSI
ncbi:MAG TPA: protein translocase subunit SecD [Bryobacteraceae bacterium]|nr:protein translocase subunit SecD [Bryobacteraceae bacterium]